MGITLSDQRLKRNIRPLALEKGDDEDEQSGGQRAPAWLLRQLRPISFHFRRDAEGDRVAESFLEEEETQERYGFVADEVQKVLPSLIRTIPHGDRGDVKGVAQQDLLALAIAAQQAQEARVEAQEIRMQAQELRMQAQQERMEALEAEHERMKGLEAGFARLDTLEALLDSLLAQVGTTK